MSANDIFDQAAVDIFNAIGVNATFTPGVGDPVSCKVDVTKEIDLQPGGYESAVWQQETNLECLLSEIGKEPDRGEQFQVGAVTYTIKSVRENDGRFVKVRVQ